MSLFFEVVMKKLKSLYRYFTPAERILWCVSAALIVIAFAVFDRTNYLTLCASLIGVTSLIFSAKGNPVGQALMVISACSTAPSPTAFPITARCSPIWV